MQIVVPPIDWGVVATTIVAFVLGVAIKSLLDLRLGVWIVRIFRFLPTRWLFRQKYPDLSGQWENIWEAGGSNSYSAEKDRHSHPVMLQFGPYIYAEFINQQELFGFFGRISGEYIVGEWFHVVDSLGYFGAYQLKIINSSHLEGMWIGHSKTSAVIRADKSVWKKLK